MIGAALLRRSPCITVAVNQVHLVVPLAITVALIIATIKGSMVAAVFMHLSHEKRWIYGALMLTVAFFIVLMMRAAVSRPMDHIGDADSARRRATQPRRRHAKGTEHVVSSVSPAVHRVCRSFWRRSSPPGRSGSIGVEHEARVRR